MLKRHSQFFKSLMLVNDLVFLTVSWWLAYLLRFHADVFPAPEPYVFRHYLIGWILILLVWGTVFVSMDLYRPRRISSRLREAGDILKGSILSLLIFLGIIFLLRDIVLSRIVVVLFWLGSVATLNISHGAVRECLRLLRRWGYNLRYVLVIGTLPQAERLIRKLQWYRHLGLKIVGVYLFEEGAAVDEVADVDVLRHRRSILDLIARGSIDQIFVTLSLEQATKVREIQEWLGDDPVTLYFVPDIGEFVRLRGAIEEFDDLHIITLQDSPLEGWNSVLKRAMDLLIGMMALILFSPLMVLIAIGVWLTSHGPILYRQERMGLDGRRFEMLKFRTMVEDAEKLTGPIWATANDPRLTALGRWLRRTSLDELPQLINVLRGEMSLVGPRPERPALIEQFRRDIPKYMLRHKVKAGMTGWAQVRGWRGDSDLGKRIELDIQYIETWSLWRDFKILAATLFRGFYSKHAA